MPRKQNTSRGSIHSITLLLGLHCFRRVTISAAYRQRKTVIQSKRMRIEFIQLHELTSIPVLFVNKFTLSIKYPIDSS